VIDSPSDNVEEGGSGSPWHLVVRRGVPGGVYSLANTKVRCAWRHKKFHQAIVAAVVKTKALSAWRYVSPAKRSGSGSVWWYVSPARRFYCSSIGVLDSVSVIYKAYGDASKVGLLMFLELWLGTYPLSCGS